MKLSDAKNYIIKEKIDLSEFFDGEECFITIREPNKNEMLKMQQSKNEDESFKILLEIFPSLIVDHNFETDNGKKANKKDVVDVIDSKTELWQFVYSQFEKVLPLNETSEEDKKK